MFRSGIPCSLNVSGFCVSCQCRRHPRSVPTMKQNCCVLTVDRDMTQLIGPAASATTARAIPVVSSSDFFFFFLLFPSFLPTTGILNESRASCFNLFDASSPREIRCRCAWAFLPCLAVVGQHALGDGLTHSCIAMIFSPSWREQFSFDEAASLLLTGPVLIPSLCCDEACSLDHSRETSPFHSLVNLSEGHLNHVEENMPLYLGGLSNTMAWGSADSWPLMHSHSCTESLDLSQCALEPKERNSGPLDEEEKGDEAVSTAETTELRPDHNTEDQGCMDSGSSTENISQPKLPQSSSLEGNSIRAGQRVESWVELLLLDP
ncbi:hypothetical protein Z043_102647 [Scleropages formosus]|uniref:Uncharacterized protein n=1 Tax=Scleropages formosus TaxID=113540 RepID=A0A0P7V753_SCLFO|nr:hypothetical protein Z043_102647 [Scleropages formosus]